MAFQGPYRPTMGAWDVLTGLSETGQKRRFLQKSDFCSTAFRNNHLEMNPERQIYPMRILPTLLSPILFLENMSGMSVPIWGPIWLRYFAHHLHNLPTTFRIYPPPLEFTHHLQNLPTTFRIYPPIFRKNRFWGLWTFLHLF